MDDQKNTYYVTTPIYYVTAKPHLGTLYSTLLADVAARWSTLQGKKVFFLTGTDEHGQKIEQAAAKVGKSPKEFVNLFIDSYKDMWKKYELGYSYFIRTTDKRHIESVQKWLKKLIDQGDVYKGAYKGWYCTPCETFVGQQDEAIACPECKRQTTAVEEESYFFKLSKYEKQLSDFYKKNPNFIVPQQRLNEVTSFVKSGLKDLSISRTTVKWGVPFPDDPDHTVYVWVEALLNYLTAIGFEQEKREQEFDRWWPAQLQVLGKDIVRFHAVYWPALLMASGLPLPEKMLVHGWIKVDDKKMSKSFGNVVRTDLLAKAYGVEPVRYYLMRQIPINQDGNFSIDDLQQRVSADLADALGNLLNRTISLAHQNDITELGSPEQWSDAAQKLRYASTKTLHEYTQLMNDYYYHQALGTLWQFIAQVNAYFHEQEPWKVVKNEEEQFKEVIAATANSLRIIAIALWPIMPKKMEDLLYAIGFKLMIDGNMIEKLSADNWAHTFVLRKVPVLFEKPEPGVFEKVVEEFSKKEKPEDAPININDVAKVQLVVGTIEICEPMPKSEKLLRMEVDFGQHGKRQVLAGIKQFYQPEDLIGKQGIFVFNLAPRKMMGTESQGMMLAAEDADGKVQMATVASPVPNGTRLR